MMLEDYGEDRGREWWRYLHSLHPPRKTAFENGAINAHKDIWEVENMKKIDFGSVNVFSPWLDLSMLINKVV